MAVCNVQELLDDAKCFAVLPPFILDTVRTQLLCNIGAALASGTAGFLSGSGSPEGVTIGAIQGQTYTDLDTSNLYVFTGTPGTDTGWVQVV